MNIIQSLRKPLNWQDFERLCQELWRSEWKSDDLKLNGRLGQQQKGIDICGHRSGFDGYYGIQCKCKKDGEKLTEKEINTIIESAKDFKPLLKHLVIATTAEKDSKLEEFVRVQSEEMRQAGLFTLDLYSWEDLVFLLEQNETVLNHYLGVLTEDSKVSVCFSDDSDVLNAEVDYLKVPNSQRYYAFLKEKRQEYSYSFMSLSKEKRMYECNYSFFEVPLLIKNLGSSSLDDNKLQLWFDRDVSLTHTREKEYSTTRIITGWVAPIELTFEKNKVLYCPRFSLVPEDTDKLPAFYVKAPLGTKELVLKWKLLSRNHHQSGELLILIKENIHTLRLEDSSVPEKKWDVVDYFYIKES